MPRAKSPVRQKKLRADAASNGRSAEPYRNAQILELLRSWNWAGQLPALDTRRPEPAAELILGWNEIENGDFRLARGYLETAAKESALTGWAHTGLAAVAMRMKEFDESHRLLDSISAAELESDPLLAATAAHVRGGALYHVGSDERS